MLVALTSAMLMSDVTLAAGRASVSADEMVASYQRVPRSGIRGDLDVIDTPVNNFKSKLHDHYLSNLSRMFINKEPDGRYKRNIVASNGGSSTSVSFTPSALDHSASSRLQGDRTFAPAIMYNSRVDLSARSDATDSVLPDSTAEASGYGGWRGVVAPVPHHAGYLVHEGGIGGGKVLLGNADAGKLLLGHGGSVLLGHDGSRFSGGKVLVGHGGHAVLGHGGGGFGGGKLLVDHGGSVVLGHGGDGIGGGKVFVDHGGIGIGGGNTFFVHGDTGGARLGGSKGYFVHGGGNGGFGGGKVLAVHGDGGGGNLGLGKSIVVGGNNVGLNNGKVYVIQGGGGLGGGKGLVIHDAGGSGGGFAGGEGLVVHSGSGSGVGLSGGKVYSAYGGGGGSRDPYSHSGEADW